LGATIGGRPVGTFGDAGIVSFGVEKICSGVGGGAVMITNDVLAEPIDKDALPPPAVSAALRNGLSNLVWRRWRRWSLPLESAVDRSRCSGPDAAPSPYPKVAMANLNAAVAFSLMETLRENIAARRARVAAYQGLLGCDERIRFITQRPGSACLTQVVRVSPRRRGQDSAARVIEGLRREGYEVQGSYVPIHLLPGFEQCVRGELWHAEKIWPDLIELPCEPTVALGHVERIAEIIKHALGRVDGHKRGAA
jgi:dTDP-4-amino-4,6-dideoxygalactose transaminase